MGSISGSANLTSQALPASTLRRVWVPFRVQLTFAPCSDPLAAMSGVGSISGSANLTTFTGNDKVLVGCGFHFGFS